MAASKKVCSSALRDSVTWALLLSFGGAWCIDTKSARRTGASQAGTARQQHVSTDALVHGLGRAAPLRGSSQGLRVRSGTGGSRTPEDTPSLTIEGEGAACTPNQPERDRLRVRLVRVEPRRADDRDGQRAPWAPGGLQLIHSYEGLVWQVLPALDRGVWVALCLTGQPRCVD